MKTVRARLTAGMIAILLFAMSIVTLISYLIAKDIILEESLGKIRNVVAQEAESMDGWLNEHKKMLSVLGTDLVLLNDKSQTKNFLEAHAALNPQLSDLYVGFSDDTGLFSYWVAPDDWLATSRGWYQLAIAADKNPVMQVYSDFSSGQLFLAFSQDIGVIEETETVLACDINLEAITGVVEGMDIAKGAYAFLTDSDGGIISHPDEKYAPTDDGLYQVKNDPIYSEVLAKQGGSDRVRFTDADGNAMYLIPYQTAEGWHLYAVVPEAVIMEAFNAGMSWNFAAVAVLILMAGLIITFTINALIVKPIKRLIDISNHMINGNLNVNFGTASKDEFGKLSEAFAEVGNTFKRLIADLGTMSKDHDEGEIDTYLEPSAYRGEYSEVAQKINIMVEGHLTTIQDSISCVAKMANGEFDAPMERLPGKKVFINNAIEEMRKNIKNVGNEVNGLVQEFLKGKLSAKADVSKFNGGWLEIGEGLNKVITTISDPIRESLSVLTDVSGGNLQSTMTGYYAGEFKTMKDVVNTTISELREIITNVSDTLSELANDNYDISVTKQYKGDFVPIKDGLNVIIDRINAVMSEINESAEQVATGSLQISQTAAKLSQGSSEQASSVNELNAAVGAISEQTRISAQTAGNANGIAKTAADNAVSGSKDMNSMLEAMNEISVASNEISKIIKAIEDIAFQTNLLALNAAVEAARAGEHGKGFSVVAEEVRTLSTRSNDAAKQTGELIEGMASRVGFGMKIADKTSDAFKVMVTDIAGISELISEIAVSTEGQSKNIDQMSSMIMQISAVTQNNAAASEEESASAELLSDQSDTFKDMVSRFKLRYKTQADRNITGGEIE